MKITTRSTTALMIPIVPAFPVTWSGLRLELSPIPAPREASNAVISTPAPAAANQPKNVAPNFIPPKRSFCRSRLDRPSVSVSTAVGRTEGSVGRTEGSVGRTEGSVGRTEGSAGRTEGSAGGR